MTDDARRTENRDESPVHVETEINNDRTVINVSGTRDAAIIVNSNSDERVYLPPEANDDTGDGPYRPVDSEEGQNPYEGIQDDSPYDSTRSTETSVGLSPTPTGFQIVHPEPATDVRFLR